MSEEMLKQRLVDLQKYLDKVELENKQLKEIIIQLQNEKFQAKVKAT